MNVSSFSDDVGFVPPELAAPVPRRTRISGAGSTTIVYAFICLGLAVAGFSWLGTDAAQQMSSKTALRQDGSEAVADFEWTPRSFVKYSFSLDGKLYTGEALVPEQLRDRIRKSGHLSVRYLPGKPSVNHPVGWEDSSLSILGPLVVPIVPVVIGIGLLLPFGRERQLAAQGVHAIATITGSSRGRNSFLVVYEFRAKDGSLMKGQGSLDKSQEIGAKIGIVYLPSDPTQNLPYPLSLYSVVQ